MLGQYRFRESEVAGPAAFPGCYHQQIHTIFGGEGLSGPVLGALPDGNEQAHLGRSQLTYAEPDQFLPKINDDGPILMVVGLGYRR